LTFNISLAGLSAGTYTSNVTVSSPGAGGLPQTVAVTLIVSPPAPLLTISTGSIGFSGTAGGANPASQNVNILNAGGGSISWSAAKTQSWLSLSATSGVTPAALTIGASIATLTPGTYTDTVTISAPGIAGSPQTVTVTFVVAAPPPVLGISTNGLSFSGV